MMEICWQRRMVRQRDDNPVCHPLGAVRQVRTALEVQHDRHLPNHRPACCEVVINPLGAVILIERRSPAAQSLSVTVCCVARDTVVSDVGGIFCTVDPITLSTPHDAPFAVVSPVSAATVVPDGIGNKALPALKSVKTTLEEESVVIVKSGFEEEKKITTC